MFIYRKRISKREWPRSRLRKPSSDLIVCLELLPERAEFQLFRISRVGGRTGLLASYSLETLNSTPKPVYRVLGEDGEGGNYLQREKELVGLEEDAWGWWGKRAGT